MSRPRVLAVVPAREGSKGLPDKNVRPLSGMPLLVHSLRTAEQCTAVQRCVVSTDSERIAEIARAYGGDVPFLRPAELATDTAPTMLALRHALETVEAEEGRSYDAVLLLEPTSPVRDPDHLSAAIDRLVTSPALDGVVSVSEPAFKPSWVGVREAADGVVERYYEEGRGVTRRQDAPRFLRINGNFYVWRSEFVRRSEGPWLDEGHHGMIEIHESLAFSIDDEFEFTVIEALQTAGVITLPGSESERVRSTGA